MREKLLIVDDEPGIVEMMASYFAPQYQVLTAHSGAEALEKAEAGPDLILLDINMPGMDGLTVCQTIRDHIACPILFLTARVESADKIAGFQAGADDYIVKPFDLDELGARVEAHLRREQRRQCSAAVRFFGELVVDYAARTVVLNGEPGVIFYENYDYLDSIGVRIPDQIRLAKYLMDQGLSYDKVKYPVKKEDVLDFACKVLKNKEITFPPIKYRDYTIKNREKVAEIRNLSFRYSNSVTKEQPLFPANFL